MTRPLEEQSREELLAYIKNVLRPENKELRQSNDTYAAAFEQFGPAEQRALLTMIGNLGDDPALGARQFMDFGRTILGVDDGPDLTHNEQQETTVTDQSNEEAPAWAQALVERLDRLEQAQGSIAEREEEAQIRALKQKATDLGYQEGTSEWARFFQIAGSLAGGDLDEAHQLYGRLYGTPEPEAGAGAGEEGGAPAPAPEVTEEPAPDFPKTPAAGGNGSPAPKTGEDKGPLSMKDARQAFMDRMAAVAEGPAV